MPGLLASGATLTAEASGTNTTLVVTANPNVTAGQIIAFKTGANTSGFAYCVSQSGSGPYTVAFSPAAPNATLSGDTALLCDLGILLSKDDSAFAVPAGTALADIGRGYYSLGANAADMNTIGELKIAWDVYGATAGVSNEKEYQITAGVPANATGGSVASVSGDIGGISGVTLPASIPSLATMQAGLPTDASIAMDVQTGLTAQGYSTSRAGYLDTLNGIVAAIWAATTRTLTSIGNSAGVTTLLTYFSGAVAPQSGDAYARLGAPAGASVSADIATANAALTLSLSLIGQNQGVRNQQYDSNGNLLSADICAYDTAAHATTNDGATGLVHKWTLALTYSGTQQATQSLSQVS